ncbi:hypothetical protein [Nonomuraea sp. NPDC050786]|uniref:hypothetical protein n=1 Tax=Nonomuraea sp. NPDC050786 TaxID=3154840 RepID=UPI0033F60EB3
MSQTPRDEAYDRAQSRLTREAGRVYERPDWGDEDPRIRQAYDRELRRQMRVNGKGKRR